MDAERSAQFHWQKATEETNHANNRVTWAAILQLGLLAVIGGSSVPSGLSVQQVAWFGVALNTAAVVGFLASWGAASNLLRMHDRAMESLEASRTEAERSSVPLAVDGRGGGQLVWHVLGTASSLGIVLAYYVAWYAFLR